MGTIEWTFKTWLQNFIGVDLPIGDLAKDICGDAEFPDSDAGEIFEYVGRKCRSDYVVMDTLATVWAFYSSSARTHLPL